MRRALVTAALLVTMVGCTATSENPQPSSRAATETPYVAVWRVVRVTDGDTIRVRDQQGVEEMIRMIGLDTPETVHPSKPVMCGGRAATLYARQHLGNKIVHLVDDPSQGLRDRYDRRLAYVEVRGWDDYGRAAIAQGHAREYTYNVRRPYARADEYRRAQTFASERVRGIWRSCDGRVDLPDTSPTATEKPPPLQPTDIFYENCSVLRHQGVMPLTQGEPGFRTALDGDKDGLACE